MHDSMKSYDLEERLLTYSAEILRIVENLNPTKAGAHVGDHLMRAGTSPLFNHGEAESAESGKDFIHKMTICLKELRETKRALRLAQRVPLSRHPDPISAALAETEELIRIFYASIRTARSNHLREDAPTYDVNEAPPPEEQ
jgi:four helix bundle protein